MSPDSAADPAVEALRARLAASRAELLEAVGRLTERDFASDLGGVTVAQLLAGLAAAERAAVARVRAARALESRPALAAPLTEGGRILPPQAIHGLAGARYETLLLIEALTATPEAPRPLDILLPDADNQDTSTPRSVLESIAERELAAAERIRSREAPR